MRNQSWKSLGMTLMMMIAVSLSPMQVSATEDAHLQTDKQELHTMQSDLQGLNTQLQTTLTNARSLELQVSNLMFQSRALQQQINKKQKQIQQRNELFKQRLSAMYQEGDVSLLDVLLESKDFSDFLDRFDMLTLIVKQDHDLINELHTEHARLEAEQKQLAAEQKEQESKQEQLFAMEKNLQQQIQDKKSQVDTKQNQMDQQEQVIAAQQAVETPAAPPQSLPTLASRGGLVDSSSVPYTMMVATAYTAPSTARTASGTQVGTGTIAVDPRVIPLGTKLYVEGYGYGMATDTGLDIKGNRVDLFFTSVDPCIMFGRRVVKVYRVS